MNKFLPLIFVLLWSSAFVTTKPIVDNSDPFAALAFRFFIVALGFLIYSVYQNLSLKLNKKDFIQSFTSGVLFHGVYLGGVFFSVSKDIPTGITALIVTMQPILTNALAGPFLKEHVGWKQWLGVILGFIGSAMVLGVDIGVTLPAIGIIASVIALLSITSATLFQKKYSGNIPLPVSNMYQAAGGCFFHLIIILFFVDPFIEFNSTFLIAMSHQIFLVSFGAFTILMFLIKNNSASKTVTVFFLIPATTAFMAWIFLNEQLTLIDLIGFIVATLGVFIATRNK
ncbi:MAG: DMT family transporter [Candidatus Pelagibacter sp.]